jgi:flagellar export protein FliJ
LFRLHRLLEWKETLARQAWAQRAALEHKVETMRGTAERLRAERAGLRAAPPEKDGAEAIAELAQWARYAEGLRRREESLRARLEALRPELESRVRAHTELQKEVKGLHKLRLRALRRRKKRSEKRQQDSIDDAAARRSFPGSGRSFPDAPPGARAERPGPIAQ